MICYTKLRDLMMRSLLTLVLSMVLIIQAQAQEVHYSDLAIFGAPWDNFLQILDKHGLKDLLYPISDHTDKAGHHVQGYGINGTADDHFLETTISWKPQYMFEFVDGVKTFSGETGEVDPSVLNLFMQKCGPPEEGEMPPGTTYSGTLKKIFIWKSGSYLIVISLPLIDPHKLTLTMGK